MDIQADNYTHFAHFVIHFSFQTVTLKYIVIRILLLCNLLIIAMETAAIPVCQALNSKLINRNSEPNINTIFKFWSFFLRIQKRPMVSVSLRPLL